MTSIPKIITYMTTPDALGPIIGLETTVTGGRTVQAYKRGGENEARERFIEEATGAVVWLWGVKCINDYIGDPILKKMFGANFDVGTDKVLRTPFENFLKEFPQKKFTPGQVAGIKAFKVLASVLIADAFIGLVVPPLNQKLTRVLFRKKLEESDTLELQNKQEKDSKTSNSPSFKGFDAINVFTHAIENTNTGKLLSTDAGLASGRIYSARNNEERKEIAIRDLGSIYFYMWAQNHVGNLLNFAESGRFNRLNPSSAELLDKYLVEFLEKNGGELTAEEFRRLVLGKNPSEVELPIGIRFETGEVGKFTQFMDKLRSKTTEPLQVAKVSDLEGLFSEEIFDRIKGMSNIQPLRQGEAVVTKQQIIDAINVSALNDPKFLDDAFDKFTGGHVDKKTGKYVNGASKDQFKYVSNSKLYNLKQEMVDYIEDLCKKAKDGKITKDVLKNAKNKNLAFSAINFVAGFTTAAIFLSTLIPKFQYWYTKHTTGKDEFPGVYNLEEDVKKEMKLEV